jgi:hypothetical protein
VHLHLKAQEKRRGVTTGAHGYDLSGTWLEALKKDAPYQTKRSDRLACLAGTQVAHFEYDGHIAPGGT